MRVLNTLSVPYQGETRTIELCQGDLAALDADDGVDILIVSAYPDDYTPTRTSLIGALYARGVDVARLAEQKEADLRSCCSCWISRPLTAVDFGRLLCFEPYVRGNPPDVVGDIFRALFPFVGRDGRPDTVAMPLVATGDQQVRAADMLDPLLLAATEWLSRGLPVKTLKIVVRGDKAAEAMRAFDGAKSPGAAASVAAAPRISPGARYDAFISYSHAQTDDMTSFCSFLLERNPRLRLFVDRLELKGGVAWQQAIFEALDVCRAVVPMFSPDYLRSKVCIEEFNIAMLREWEEPQSVLFPLYLYSTTLPPHMRVRQYHDCREGDREGLRCASSAFVDWLTV